MGILLRALGDAVLGWGGYWAGSGGDCVVTCRGSPDGVPTLRDDARKSGG